MPEVVDEGVTGFLGDDVSSAAASWRRHDSTVGRACRAAVRFGVDGWLGLPAGLCRISSAGRGPGSQRHRAGRLATVSAAFS